MKKQNNILLIHLTREELGALTTIVKETVIPGYQPQAKTFGPADLWNIQNQKRNFGSRRFRF